MVFLHSEIPFTHEKKEVLALETSRTNKPGGQCGQTQKHKHPGPHSLRWGNLKNADIIVVSCRTVVGRDGGGVEEGGEGEDASSYKGTLREEGCGLVG